MVAANAGDGRAYHALLGLCAERLRAYFRRRLDSDSDTEDLVQETLMAVHAKRSSYQEALPFSAWLHGIARYRLIDHYRRSGLRRHVSLDDGPEFAAEGDVAARLAQLDVATLLGELPSKQAAAIRLTRIEGHSVREAAERSGQSEPAVKVNVHRGLKRLMALVRGGEGS